jgi:hypothetical protein
MIDNRNTGCSDGDNRARLERAYEASTTKQFGWPLTPEAITPDTPAHIIIEISKSPQLSRFKEELIRGAQARQALMILRQHRLNQANAHLQQIVTTRGKLPSWRKIAEIDMEVVEHMRQMDGKDCWEQPDYISKFLRDNPGCRIKYPAPARVTL